MIMGIVVAIFFLFYSSQEVRQCVTCEVVEQIVNPVARDMIIVECNDKLLGLKVYSAHQYIVNTTVFVCVDRFWGGYNIKTAEGLFEDN